MYSILIGMRSIWIALAALVIGGVIGWFIGTGHPSYSMMSSSQTMQNEQTTASKDQVLMTDMRKLWEDHITWTRLWIVDFASDNGFADADAARLMKNQEDIGNAIKPYYGDAAGNQLTTLLKEHISGAVTLVTAAKNNDTAALSKANTEWYNNGQQIADFLAKANSNWTQSDLRSMMKSHLDLTKQEAVDILGKKYETSIADYDNVHEEILQMADALSGGIVHQFPDEFK